ncbi:protein angel homolog 2 [Anopheles aquasalis]|uniref:protein angel homolog 2 n=1 Tax=Anopheles aquasalis TaxID=42839 RepID=UPI00215B16B0|nr:protein angel homolog 2 [Anopheles aquasalis]
MNHSIRSLHIAITSVLLQQHGRRSWCSAARIRHVQPKNYTMNAKGTSVPAGPDQCHRAQRPPVAYQDANRRWQQIKNEQDSSYDETTPTKRKKRKESFEFTLMSYNILAQDLLDGHLMELYRNHDPRSLPWQQRLKRLLTEIHHIRPDVLCVQELQQNHIKRFANGLADFRYEMLYKKRTGGVKTDGCAVFFRSDLFELIDHHEVEFFQPKVNKLNRDNVAIIAKLALKHSPQTRLVVSTTHLLFNPSRQDVRLAQIQVLLAELDRFSYSGQTVNGVPQYDPVLLCGDFNLQPFTAPYRLMMKGSLRYDQLASRTLECQNQEEQHCREPTGKLFLPRWLGITDRCQHEGLKDRETTHPNMVPPSDRTRLHHSTKSTEQPEDPAAQAAHEPPSDEFSSGTLNHHFVFHSAYHHGKEAEISNENNPTATTFQERWITVDYLLYTPFRSIAECCPSLPNWNLELLATYSLPTVAQCRRYIRHIPSRFYGSDHFSLAGRFRLTTPATEQNDQQR